MDSRRACPSYEAGFNACDPLGSVLEWSGREPARILRRRCRSEGVERSPYEDANRETALRYHRALPNKSYFTLNSECEQHLDRFHHECLLPAAENGDYVMSHDTERYLGYQPGRSKFYRTSPTRSLLVTTLSNTKVDESRLPKVEELLERVDQEMMDVQVAKQPLKSILNNPIPTSPLHGILKKPKSRSYQDPRATLEGRRRQRASSESDNLYSNYNLGTAIPGYDRLSHLSNMKRAKDNSGLGYSYGSAIASLGVQSPMRCKSPTKSITSAKNYKHSRCACKDQVIVVKDEDMHLLRTSAINNETVNYDPIIDMVLPRQDTPTPTCPAVSPALPVSSVTTIPIPKKLSKTKKKVKSKTKVARMKSSSKVECSIFELDTDDHELSKDSEKRNVTPVNSCHPPYFQSKVLRPNSRSPSPDNMETWQMETDAALAQIEELEKNNCIMKEIEKPKEKLKVKDEEKIQQIDQTSISNLTSKLNGAMMTPKRNCSREKMNLSEKINKDQNSFLAALHTTNPFKAIPATRKESPICLPDTVTSCLRQSLFPRVPPYLKFIGHDDTPCLKIPLPIQKHLKWKLTTITPIVVKRTLTNSGFRLVKSECDTAECPQEVWHRQSVPNCPEDASCRGETRVEVSLRGSGILRVKGPEVPATRPETIEWIGIWGKHMKSIMFRAIKDGQKMNHFPGTFQIGRKDRLWRNLQKLVTKHGLIEFGIMPKTYVLPNDLKLLKHDWEKYAANNEKWIIKPPASARGTGIKVVSKWAQIPKKRPVVVQRYVSKPYLINGNKFDLRLYVLVTSVHPLRIFLYKDGLARFASVKYNDELASLNDRYMHLTNYSINRLSKNYTPNEDFAACEGHKWTLQTLFQYLKTEKKVDTEALWESMKDLVIKTIIAGEASISSLTKANITSRYNCYELFGIDVLLDEELKPWLLEVNISPSLHSASPLDIHVKGPLVTTVLNIAQFQVPVKTNLEMLSKDKPHKLAGLPYDSRLYTVYLSKEERDKHIIYTNMEERELYLRDILSTLTPDDVRHLIQAEDELTQIGADMERVFPTHDSYKYLAFLTGPRYYNRLFDAWESRYGRKREPGIELLRNLCEIGYHLEVPPVPLKNDVDAPSVASSERPSVVSVASLGPCACNGAGEAAARA